MAGAAVPLRNALVRLGLTQPAATFAIDAMGMDTLVKWRDFETDDELTGLSKSLRSPGGGQTQQDGTVIRHPGFLVSPEAIGNLKKMRLALKHHQHIQRTVAANEITVQWIARWKFLVEYQKKTAKAIIDEDALPKIVMSDWAKTKEKVITHFSQIYGTEGIPLAYLLRERSEVPDEADDPQEENYGTDHIKELIARAPHDGDLFDADNRTLCRLLKKMCDDTPAYEYISKYTANGRKAWQDLLEVYLGPQHTQNQAAIYEAKLTSSHYDGESTRFTFDKLVNIHKQAHTRLAGLEKYGYKGIDEGTKIRHLLNAIRTEKLKTVKELIRGNDAFNTFDKAVRRIKDSVIVETPKKQRTISSVQGPNKDPYPNVQPDMNVEDKFYASKDWAKLTPAQRKGVLKKRAKRKQKNANGGNPPDPDTSSGGEKISLKKFKRHGKKLAKLERRIAALSGEGDDDDSSGADSDSTDEEAPSSKKQKGTTNRNHPALKRKGRKH